MSYIRKRALLACDFCRHRKRRCTGEQPCSTCVESKAECRYKELPVDRIESPSASNDAIVERLGRIEALLEDQAQQLQVLASGGLQAASRVSRTRTRSPGEGGSRSPPPFDAATFPYVSTPAGLSTTSSVSSLPIVLVSPELAHPVPQDVAHQGSSASLSVPLVVSPHSFPLPPPVAGFAPSPAAYDHVTPDAVTSHAAQEQNEFFLIPLDHSTAANTLLSLPLVRHFLIQRHAALFPSGDGQDDHSLFTYERTYFFDIESAYPLPPLLDLDRDLVDLVGPSLSTSSSGELRLWWPPPALRANLTAAYFARVHPNAPLFGSAVFRQWDAAEQRIWQDNDGSGDNKTIPGTPSIRTAACLVVWALGALVGDGDVPESEVGNNSQESRDHLAMLLFRPAFKILLHHALWEFEVATLSVGQALLLAASFFSHIGRPLHSARLVYLANRHLLRLLEEERRQGREPHENDPIFRVLWIGFVLECDRAAELHVPRSGIEPVADKMPLPGSLDPDDASDSDNMIYFVAEISARRLLNRVHSSLYASTPPSSLATAATTTTPRAAAAAAAAAADTPTRRHSHSMAAPGSKRKHRHDSESHSTPSYGSTTGVPLLPPPPLPTHTSIAKMLSISAELKRQHEVWYHTIPQTHRPPLLDVGAVLAARISPASTPQTASSSSSGSSGNERVQLLRIYYYAVLHLIYRPFVLHVAWQVATAVPASYPSSKNNDANEYKNHETGDNGSPNDAFKSMEDNDDDDDNNDNDGHRSRSASSLILDHCVVCVNACMAYLVHVLPLLGHRSPYLWSLCQGSMACLLVLLVADACPEIVSRRQQQKRQRQHRHGKQATKDVSLDLGWLCDQVAGQLRRWAAPGSSFAAELAIIEQLPVCRAGPAQHA